ncbi:MAG: hypothetical protein CO119_03470 [Flavobacteriales bacterium CG_4_9_14_3_um_filter_40_17]|nr:MAG: hypothetical protein CO119_03470 [Flavobacteriales bacterium CG_4_9_14_3_um_filter_40_17]
MKFLNFNPMKSIVTACLIFVLALSSACSNSSDNFIVGQETVSITAVDAPDTLIIGQRLVFKVSYNVPTTCHDFLRVNFSIEGKETTISIVTTIKEGNCNNLTNASQIVDVEAAPNEAGIFTFKFFTGFDSQGNPTFIVKEYDVAPRPI